MKTTFPQLLMAHAQSRPNAPAMREKEYGIWQTTTWAQLAQLVRDLAAGLHQRGLRRGRCRRQRASKGTQQSGCQ
jgi:long-chain acyl-CoA synthetase